MKRVLIDKLVGIANLARLAFVVALWLMAATIVGVWLTFFFATPFHFHAHIDEITLATDFQYIPYVNAVSDAEVSIRPWFWRKLTIRFDQRPTYTATGVEKASRIAVQYDVRVPRQLDSLNRSGSALGIKFASEHPFGKDVGWGGAVWAGLRGESFEVSYAERVLNRLLTPRETEHVQATTPWSYRFDAPIYAPLIVLVAILLVMPRSAGPFRRWRRRRRNLCVGCGYSLEGNLSGVCPECGLERVQLKSEKETMDSGRAT